LNKLLRAAALTTGSAALLLATTSAGLAASRPRQVTTQPRAALGITTTTLSLVRCCATRVAWSPDGKLVLVIAQDSLQVQRSDGTGVATVVIPNGQFRSVAWTPDSLSFAIGSGDGIVRLYTAGGAPLRSFSAGHGPVNAVAWSTDGSLLVTASSDGTVNTWTTDGEHFSMIIDNGEPVLDVAWSQVKTRHGNIIAFASTQRVTIKTTSNRFIARVAQGSGVTSLAWSPSGVTLATGAAGGALGLWSFQGAPLATLAGNGVAVASLAWSPDGTRIAAGMANGSVQILSSAGALLGTASGFGHAAQSVSWSSDSQRLVVAAGSQVVYVLKVTP
jgi:WD40 repeat protein